MRRSRDDRGQALVEFSLVVVVFILLLMGIFDLGRAVFSYTSITNGAREGARLGVVNQDATQIRTRAVNAAAMADQSAAAVTVAVSKATSAPTANDCTPVVVGCTVSVTYTTSYRPVNPLLAAVVGQITVTAHSVEPIEHVCGVTGAPTPDPSQCPKQA
jgi:Flp pilus assembly protein TadG